MTNLPPKPRGFPVAALLCLVISFTQPFPAQAADPTFVLDCADTMGDVCRDVVPNAARFEAVKGQKYQAAYDANDKLLGWLMISTDAVDIKAYSSKPLVTLVGLNPDAVITGGRVLHHSEPILLVGIPEQKLHDFVDFYVGKKAVTKVVVGQSPDPNAVTVDVISGATVTALAQNQTILETARTIGTGTGVIRSAELNPGAFVQGDRVWTWAEMEQAGVFGRLTVTEAQMGTSERADAFVDVWFTVLDAPHIGRGILGDREYDFQFKRLKPGEHLVAIFGNGSSSFKGSGFVRGGSFDRVRIEQGLRSLIFRDSDYTNFGRPAAEDAPSFKEGAVFVARGGLLDPGAGFDLVFLGSRYDGKGGFSREFKAFKSTFRLPSTVYKVENAERDLVAEMVDQAWYNNRTEIYILIAYLLLVMGLFAGRRWLTRDMRRLQIIHTSVLVVSFAGLGLWLHAQPSITQVLTLVGSIVGEWSWGLFQSEPLLFIFWINIAIVTIAWGRGVFCGWTCPYGAMSELLYKIGHRLGLKPFELPDAVHLKARYLRYVALVILVAAFLYDPETGEKMAEIEPFKSTFFVEPWNREVAFFTWWAALAALSLFWWRPFCRYLCPLGAALALPASFRISGPYRREFCTKCKICTKQCEPKAIRPDGTIDARECLQCMECEANYGDQEVCPPLIGIDRLRIGAHKKGGEPDAARMARLVQDAETVRRFTKKKQKRNA